MLSSCAYDLLHRDRSPTALTRQGLTKSALVMGAIPELLLADDDPP
jgi:hypothetical protein